MAKLKEWLRSWFPTSRENEYDTRTPGGERPLTGVFGTLSEKQKREALSYDGPEYLGSAQNCDDEERRASR